ncbi:MAG TPA: hypothetical protein VE620_06050 [Myxococcales bacterium]|jgi:hypothetical protein|nr:hypothetical protein [Myxococcales bacterium]
MRTFAHWLAFAPALLLTACSSEDNYVLSGYAPVVISPVRSALAAQVNFTDTSGTQHQQWVIAMTDSSDVCTKLQTNKTYFQMPVEVFNAAIVWVPPGNLGTYFVGQQNMTGSTAGNEVLVGLALADGGSPQLTKLTQVNNVGATISLSQFNVGAGGQAVGSFDVAVFDPSGFPREFVGKFKTSYCTAMEQAVLP